MLQSIISLARMHLSISGFDSGVLTVFLIKILELTTQKADFLFRMEAGQMSILIGTIRFSVLPCLHGFSLKVVAKVSEEKVSYITMGLWPESDERLIRLAAKYYLSINCNSLPFLFVILNVSITYLYMSMATKGFSLLLGIQQELEA